MDFSLTPEQQDLQARAEKLGRSFADEARAWDASDEAPYRDIFDRVGAEGLFGIAMPTEYGGQGGGALEYLIVVEALFAYPGVGSLLVQAVTLRDVTEVQAITIVLAAIYIMINILADLLVVFLVPKLRTGI